MRLLCGLPGLLGMKMVDSKRNSGGAAAGDVAAAGNVAGSSAVGAGFGAAAEAASAGAVAKPARRRAHRRVTTAAPQGSDPHPEDPFVIRATDENDVRLLGDRPPHWA